MSFSEEVHRKFEDAAKRYYRALEQADVTEDEKSHAAHAWATYVEEASPSSELYDRATNAYRRYTDIVHEIWAAGGRAGQAAEAYGDYVCSVREAWVGVEPERLDPASFATLTQSMLGVAWTTSLCTRRPAITEFKESGRELWTAAEEPLQHGVVGSPQEEG